MKESLHTYLPAVKARVSPDAPMGVSSRISASSQQTLTGEPDARRELNEFLAANDLYLYTVNAFPYGPFKGEAVMENVYEPDWTTDDRTTYLVEIAKILAEVCEPGVEPSIQSAPLAFAPKVTNDSYVEEFTDNVLRVVSAQRNLERETKRRVKLALEPEPACYLESTEETVTYFADHLYSAKGLRRLGEIGQMPISEAIGAIRPTWAWSSMSVITPWALRISPRRWTN